MGTSGSITQRLCLALFVLLAIGAATPSAAQPPPPPPPELPPVPVPPQNPITEPKRLLGKILFWEEQLSFDNTVACGTCHRPGQGAADPRDGRNPGDDGVLFTDDDVLGSEGVRYADASGQYVPHPIFGDEVQVTGRATPGFFGSLWAPELFWDGRARQQFFDPESGQLRIPNGGALENQALGPILNDAEMAHQARTWPDVTSKLTTVAPLALATDLPPDVADALAADPNYAHLFAAAFGDPTISAERIAFAIATYERTLLANQTPYDRFAAGDNNALTQRQRNGWNAFAPGPCSACHAAPFFTNNSFRNIGLRPVQEDAGRADVTNLFGDRGRFKVPSLRNVGLRPRLMHTGQIVDTRDAFDFYINPSRHFTENQDPIVLGGLPAPPPQVLLDIVEFLETGLTDPRVAAETFPFDRPTLRSEQPATVDPIEIAWRNQTVEMAPNPFRAASRITFHLTGSAPATVEVFNLAGERVRSLYRGSSPGGPLELVWDGRDARGALAAAGVYFVRLETAGATASGRVVKVE